MKRNSRKISESSKRKSEASFSLLETVIALGLMAVFLLEVASVQGNAIYFGEYGLKSTKAVWLARQVLAKVEYEAHFRPFNDLKASMMPEDGSEFENFKEEDFRYNLSIEEWKLPLFNLMGGGGSEDGEEGGEGAGGEAAGGDMISGAIKQVFDGEPMFKIAKVEVSWPEGAHRNSVDASLLIANQIKVNEAFAKLGLKEPSTSKAGDPAGTTGGGATSGGATSGGATSGGAAGGGATGGGATGGGEIGAD